MSHTKVKTTYQTEGAYGSTETHTLYCHHNHSCDCVTFYNERGEVESMAFCEWISGNDLWDAMNRLWFPFEGEWNDKLKNDVEYYCGDPGEQK
jgi:hypothetical protein